MNDAVVLVGLLSWQQRVIDYIHHQMACQAILLQPDTGEEYYMTTQADRVIEIDLSDEGAIGRVLQELAGTTTIRAICTLTEYYVPLVAQLARQFNLKGLDPTAALNCRHKKRTRQVLAQHGLASPRFAIVRNVSEAVTALSEIPLPVVVKPSNDSGSAMVARCDTQAEVEAAVQTILSQSKNSLGLPLDRDILVETYLSGPEYSVEACTIDGETQIFAITAKTIYSPVKAFEIKHTVPAPLTAAKEMAVCRLVEETLAALGVDNSVTHTEVMLTESGPFIIEVNARAGGDMISELVKAARGFDLYEVTVHISAGGSMHSLPCYPPQTKSATIQFLYADKSGVVFLKNLPEPTAGVQTFFPFYRSGNLVKETKSNFNRLGYVITYDTESQTSAEVAGQVVEALELHIRTDWPTVLKWRLISLIYLLRERLAQARTSGK